MRFNVYYWMPDVGKHLIVHVRAADIWAVAKAHPNADYIFGVA